MSMMVIILILIIILLLILLIYKRGFCWVSLGFLGIFFYPLGFCGFFKNPLGFVITKNNPLGFVITKNNPLGFVITQNNPLGFLGFLNNPLGFFYLLPFFDLSSKPALVSISATSSSVTTILCGSWGTVEDPTPNNVIVDAPFSRSRTTALYEGLLPCLDLSHAHL